MNTDQIKKRTGGFFTLIKNLFILLLFLQFAPMIFVNIKNYFQELIVPKSQVGQLNIKGLISDSTFYVKNIQKFLKDPQVKALFIKIDSPGGLPGSSQAIFNELNIFKKEKPIVVLVENVCASGGYYIASASNHIIASSCALVGSIGVLLQLPNVKELLENWKIKFKYIQSGKFKTAGSPLKDSTPEELAYLQKLSDGNYDQFTKDVAQSRKISLTQSKTWADGKVFLGIEAKKINLIDEIGSLQNAKDAIKKLAKIEDEIKFVLPKRPTGIMRLFAGEEDDADYSGSDFSCQVATFLHNVYTKFIGKL